MWQVRCFGLALGLNLLSGLVLAYAPAGLVEDSPAPAAKAEKSVAQLCAERDEAADEREAQRADAELQKRDAQDQCSLTQLETPAQQPEKSAQPEQPEQNPRGADARATETYEARGWAALPRGSTRSDEWVYVSKAEAARTDTPYGWAPGSKTSDYGPRASKRTLNGQFMSSNHKGRDYNIGGEVRSVQTGEVQYRGGAGYPVKAAGDGKVISVKDEGGYGTTVRIQHSDGQISQYSHLQKDSPVVKPGQKVVEGSILGRVGQTGNSTGAHLHYEERVGGKAVNPRGNVAGIRNYGASNDFMVADVGAGAAATVRDRGSTRQARIADGTATLRNDTVMSLARQSLSNPVVQQMMGNGAGLLQSTGLGNMGDAPGAQQGGWLANLLGFNTGGQGGQGENGNPGYQGGAINGGQVSTNPVMQPRPARDLYALDLWQTGELDATLERQMEAWRCEDQQVTPANRDLLTPECATRAPATAI